MIKQLSILLFLLSSVFGAAQTNTLVFKLKILPVKHVETSDTLTDVKVKIIGTDGSSSEYVCDSLGGFPHIELKSKTSYSTVVSKDRFLIAKGKETTVGQTTSKVFVHEYVLQPLFICHGPKLPAPYYLFNEVKPIVVKDEMAEANYLVNIMNDNPTLVIQVLGYRGADEKLIVSRQRAINYRKAIIAAGIAAERIVLKDGGIRGLPETNKQKEIDADTLEHYQRTVLTKVVSTDYKPNKK